MYCNMKELQLELVAELVSYLKSVMNQSRIKHNQWSLQKSDFFVCQ